MKTASLQLTVRQRDRDRLKAVCAHLELSEAGYLRRALMVRLRTDERKIKKELEERG